MIQPQLPGAATVVGLLLLSLLAASACTRGEDPAEGFYEIADGASAEYQTAYIAAVQVPRDEVEGYVLLRNNWDGPADLGGWAIVGRNNRRVNIPPSTVLEPKGELRLRFGDQGEDGDLVLETDEEILEWDRLSLVDAAGEQVSRFVYGR